MSPPSLSPPRSPSSGRPRGPLAYALGLGSVVVAAFVLSWLPAERASVGQGAGPSVAPSAPSSPPTHPGPGASPSYLAGLPERLTTSGPDRPPASALPPQEVGAIDLPGSGATAAATVEPGGPPTGSGPSMGDHGGGAVMGGGNPVDCSGYPEPRVFLEVQDWWLQTPGASGTSFGHVHVGTCFPYGATLSGPVAFDVRGVMHDNPGVLQRVDIALFTGDDSGGIITAVPFGVTCAATCTYWGH